MRTADFDYTLPPDRIAQHPVARGESRLLYLPARSHVEHRHVGDLPELLRPGDRLVVNDTKVIPARLLAMRQPGGGRLELLLVEKISATEWLALAKPAKRARVGDHIIIDPPIGAEILEKQSDAKLRIRFSEAIESHLDRLGHVPLPPYIRRSDEPADRDAYQTVYAREPGAVAAPTAGLHFTEVLLDRLERVGVALSTVTLHVGIGTFRPVTAVDVAEHRMEAERFRVSSRAASEIASTRAAGGRIVAVGTTVVRTLETLCLRHGAVTAATGESDLFIRPGFRFAAVDLLLTNFHLPRSTLLMLVCAFAGRDRVLAAYREAIDTGYRFYSYGDCMLVERTDA